MMIKKFSILGIIAAGVLLLVAISFNDNKNYSNVKEHQTYQVTSHADYAMAGDIEGLVNFSDYVVTGHYEKLLENWDMGERYYSNVYKFVIDEVNYGEVSGEIEVAIPHFRQLSTIVEDEEYTANVELPNYTQPELGQKFVLFLKKYEPKNIFTPASVPFQIEINKENLSILKFNENNNQQEVRTKNNDSIIFSGEEIDVDSIDKVTGLEKEDLMKQITEAITKKK
ncbi:MAG: hypothetical protein ACE3L7_14525 [Candidatus Pristimantibacillus sp.]